MSNDLDRRFLLGGLTGVAGAVALARLANAGPINPPAGPVTGTGKTLSEAEPRIAINATNTPPVDGAAFRISQPGSYYLPANIATVNGFLYALQIEAPAVIDLCGYTISSGFTSGVPMINATAPIVLRNGRLSGGVQAIETSQECVVEDVRIESCVLRGARVPGGSVFRRCIFRGTPSYGHLQYLSAYGLVEDCSFNGGTGWGFSSFSGFATVRGCEVVNCGTGIIGQDGSLIERCLIRGCSVWGVLGAGQCTVRDCVLTGMSGASAIAIDLGAATTVTGCALSGNRIGVRLSSGGRVADCSFDGHSGPAVKITGSNSIVEDCTFTRNGTAVDMQNVGNNLVHKCTMLGNTGNIAVNVGGNWYPNIPLSGVNTTTNPEASVFG